MTTRDAKELARKYAYSMLESGRQSFLVDDFDEMPNDTHRQRCIEVYESELDHLTQRAYDEWQRLKKRKACLAQGARKK